MMNPDSSRHGSCFDPAELVFRPSEEKDLEQLTAIYNEQVLHGTATFDEEPKTVDQRREWLLAHNRENHPLISCLEGENGPVIGYASLSTYNPKDAYSSSVELSIYVAKKARGMGVGTRLMEQILRLAKEDPRTHLVISLITSENTASLSLHRKFGFTFAGRVPEVGTKFGRWLNVDTYYLKV